jgi:Protein of unknown function (DUF2934)
MTERKEPSKGEISHVAYGLYLERGCEAGKDVEDWLRAEKELCAEPVVTPAKVKAAQAGQNN